MDQNYLNDQIEDLGIMVEWPFERRPRQGTTRQFKMYQLRFSWRSRSFCLLLTKQEKCRRHVKARNKTEAGGRGTPTCSVFFFLLLLHVTYASPAWLKRKWKQLRCESTPVSSILRKLDKFFVIKLKSRDEIILQFASLHLRRMELANKSECRLRNPGKGPLGS